MTHDREELYHEGAEKYLNSKDAKEAVVVSITHLRIAPRHPLAPEIRAYQRERTRRIAQSGGPREPSSFTVRPRKKRRR